MSLNKLQYNSDKFEPFYVRSPFNSHKNPTNFFKLSDKKNKNKQKEDGNKIRLVDIYYYDKKKWKEQHQPKQEKTLQNILTRNSTISYLNEMLGDSGSKGKTKK
jgi:hypothetical protein